MKNIKTALTYDDIALVPNFSEIESRQNIDLTTPFTRNYNLRVPADIAKALAFGANSVILGSVLAGTTEAPGNIIERPDGLYKTYRGAASLETKVTHNQKQRNVEGESTTVPFKGSVKFTIAGLIDGLKSALSYAGANNFKEYNPDYILVTSAGITEARPHLIR